MIISWTRMVAVRIETRSTPRCYTLENTTVGTGKDQDRSGSIATWDSGDLNRTNVSIDQLIRCRKWFDWLVIDCLFVCVCVCVCVCLIRGLETGSVRIKQDCFPRRIWRECEGDDQSRHHTSLTEMIWKCPWAKRLKSGSIGIGSGVGARPPETHLHHHPNQS